uniref:Methionine aminopeptidase n=1 Tax=Oryza glumipatula TaxID=40148 RepID=A0A0E0AJ15_9ORYZ
MVRSNRASTNTAFSSPSRNVGDALRPA